MERQLAEYLLIGDCERLLHHIKIVINSTDMYCELQCQCSLCSHLE